MTRLRHPYAVDGTGEWLRGNLYAHTVESDGVRSPAEVVADYDRRGYDFLAITTATSTRTSGWSVSAAAGAGRGSSRWSSADRSPRA